MVFFQEGDVPYTLALKLKLPGAVDAVKNLYNAYQGQVPPPIPAKPIPFPLPTIDQVKLVPEGQFHPRVTEDHKAQSYVPPRPSRDDELIPISAPGQNSRMPIASAIRKSEAPLSMHPPLEAQQPMGGQKGNREGIAWYRPSFQMDPASRGSNSVQFTYSAATISAIVLVLAIDELFT